MRARQGEAARITLRKVLRAIEIPPHFFKQLLGCSHLISHNRNGIETQCYCSIIVCMLITLWTGRKPTRRTFEMVSYFFTGPASEAELVAHLEKLKKHDAAKSKANGLAFQGVLRPNSPVVDAACCQLDKRCAEHDWICPIP